MEEDKIPDIYCDGLQILVSPFDVLLQLTRKVPAAGSNGDVVGVPNTVAYVRMSLEHAKLVSILLRKVLKSHEETQGTEIAIHPNVTKALDVTLSDDWQ